MRTSLRGRAPLARSSGAPIKTIIIFYFILFRDISAKWLLGFWFVSQFFIGEGSGVAWVAHVGGFVFGVLVALAVKASGGIRALLWRREYAAAASRGSWDPTGGSPDFGGRDDRGWNRYG